MTRRVDLKAILSDPKLRRKLMIQGIIAIQAREGITTTPEQAARAYDKVVAEGNEKRWAKMDFNRVKPERDLDVEYSEVTNGMMSQFPQTIPARYRMQIHHLQCSHCKFQVERDLNLSGFARLSRMRKQMRDHIRNAH